MKNIRAIAILVFSLCVAAFFPSCEKGADPGGNQIQQGNTMIQINAISPDIYNRLQIRYNNVISSPINVTLALHLRDGQKKNMRVTVPANNKSYQQWGEDEFIVVWNYNEFYDSTGVAPTPQIDRNWDIASVEIIGVNCPDKEYGFQVLTTNDWFFYHPKELTTSVSFISNTDTVSYSDYDFIATLTQFNPGVSRYYFNFFSNKVLFFSDNQKYPLKQGMVMNIPMMVYNYHFRNYGSWPDGPQATSNGSTIVLTITKITNTHFDATFSGKLWSSMQTDTLRISRGEIKNAILPERRD